RRVRPGRVSGDCCCCFSGTGNGRCGCSTYCGSNIRCLLYEPHGQQGNRPMIRLLSLSVLLLGTVFYLPAPERVIPTLPATVRVRLFATQQPAELRVTTADGQTVLINARQAPSPFRNAGPVTIQPPGGNPIHLQYPLEVIASKGVLVIVNEMP